MVFIGLVNTIQIIQILLKLEKVKQEQELGQQIQVNTIMHLMESMAECGEQEEEFHPKFVV